MPALGGLVLKLFVVLIASGRVRLERPVFTGDGTPNWTGFPHSFLSHQFGIWEPWTINSPSMNDFLLRASVTSSALERSTWGAIKTLP